MKYLSQHHYKRANNTIETYVINNQVITVLNSKGTHFYVFLSPIEMLQYFVGKKEPQHIFYIESELESFLKGLEPLTLDFLIGKESENDFENGNYDVTINSFEFSTKKGVESARKLAYEIHMGYDGYHVLSKEDKAKIEQFKSNK